MPKSKKPQRETLKRYWQFIGRCPLCNTAYVPERGMILERKDAFLRIYVDCKKCAASVIVRLLLGRAGVITAVGMITDLSRQDALRLRNLVPLTANDILETHQYLKKYPS